MLHIDKSNGENGGLAIWLTGMSGAGKTTLGLRIKEEMQKRDRRVELLDGDVVRQLFSKELGFSREDRISNLERVIFVTGLLVRQGVIVVCSFITPYEIVRERAREVLGDYVEVYVKCDLDILVARDTKGLYKKALAGEIDNFTGISDPFEEPLSSDICVETDKETEKKSFKRIMNYLDINHGTVCGAAASDRPWLYKKNIA